jgi:hypothetical protein
MWNPLNKTENKVVKSTKLVAENNNYIVETPHGATFLELSIKKGGRVDDYVYLSKEEAIDLLNVLKAVLEPEKESV